uniref:Uncharacterized protein n=1 Tax=Cucumis melo TaxID=3656 RepID=A0A9I9DLB3_CUCME
MAAGFGWTKRDEDGDRQTTCCRRKDVMTGRVDGWATSLNGGRWTIGRMLNMMGGYGLG